MPYEGQFRDKYASRSPELMLPEFCQTSSSGARILLRTVTFCFKWPRFAPVGQILLLTAAFCFGPLCSAFGVRRPRLPLNHHSFQTKAILHCELAFQKDVVDPSLMRCVHLPTMGQSPFWTAICVQHIAKSCWWWIPALPQLRNPFLNTLSFLEPLKIQVLMAVRLTSLLSDFRFLGSNPGSNSSFLIRKDRYDHENL